ncbi:MAG: sigma 54-interacting transcriptional regulator [Gemmatimonadota bacterium]|nr:sigma 54-interacting transcriptional regulator [Gemmatimonadota bacterium]MYB56815.1 AAA domain-containing protein [Gemmatimonadota bacterium]
MNAIYPETEYNFVIGKSPQMREVYRQMQTAAKGAGSVLIAGESGTGKDLIAQYIHHKSGRAPNPFVPVNCGAIPKELFESELFGHKKGSFTGAVNETAGLFRSANTGTIFLDEITEIPLETQVKLLRVLQEKRIRPLGSTEEIPLDVQVIAATNRDLEQVLWNRSFREDLYYRLGAVTIYIPPLREHLEDIPELVAAFIQKLNRRLKRNILGVHPDIMQNLTKYSWPGNVRELENVIENAHLFSKGKWITRLGVKLEEDIQSLVRSTGEISTSLDPGEFYLPSKALSTSLRRKIQSAAKSPAGVLILGEEGTGSHMVGREIHRQSSYAKGPFVIVNCDTIPPELFEKELFGNSIFEDTQEHFEGYMHQAESGTLFLYEVTAIPYRIQVLLCRLFEADRMRPTGFSRDLPKNLRVIAYTSQDLHRALKEKSLSVGFYTRLSGFVIHIPPLREQKEKILEFADYFLKLFATQQQRPAPRIHDDALASLMAYPWPGNLLELRFVIQGALTAANFGTIQKHHLPDQLGIHWQTDGHTDTRGKLYDVEQALLQEALQKADGNKTQAARLLGISRKKVYKMLESSPLHHESGF